MGERRTKLERVDQLTEPPVVGRHYLVPTVRGAWYGILRDWPVIGGKHADSEFFDFPAPHYHLDRRFLPRRIGGQRGRSALDIHWAVTSPLQESKPGLANLPQNDPLPPPVLRRRQCLRSDIHFPTHPAGVVAMQAAFAGTQCNRGNAGWICPHRGFALGSIPADGRGVILCPMHGLQIDAASGTVLPGAAT